MSTLESVLKRLAEGDFICPVRHPEEFEILEDPVERKRAEEWLGLIGYRLVRLHDEGAFFMAHAIVTNEMRAKFREELRSIRAKLEPVVGFLETLRQAQGREPMIHAGDMIWGSEISEAVRNSTLLERRILDMREIGGARDQVVERVKRMLSYLESDGYLVQTNPTHQGYRITGKIDYLYQMIAFIAANTTHLSDDEVVDQIDKQPQLIEESIETQTADGSAPGEAPA